jgi:acetyl esterase/lipase
MSHFSILLFFALGFFTSSPAQVTQPAQPETGPGGTEYLHQSVGFQDFAEEPDGYWLFEPAEPTPDSAHVVVFVHGYGGYNPMIYGKWIKHLVQKGNIVIYPRYQRDMLSPHPDKFSANVSKAIRDALAELGKTGHVKPLLSNLAFAGHSYGGVIAADLAINYEQHEIPKPAVAMLCSPGTGRFKGGRLDSYAAMPEDLLLLILTSEDDWVVGDEFALKIFNEATNVRRRNLLRQFADPHGVPPLEATHNETYCLDTDFDCGKRNYTSSKALRVSKLDAVDYYGYWKLFDALLDCNRSGSHCDFAFGGNENQTSLGTWSDGTPVRSLKATLPGE